MDEAGYWGAVDVSAADNLWRERTIGPFLTGYETLAGSTDRVYELYGNDRIFAPELVTAITGLTTGSYEVYLVHIYQIETDRDKSAILAGLESSPDNVCDHTTYVSQLGVAAGDWAVGVSPIGKAVGNEIIVNIKGTTSEKRCNYIGVAYKRDNVINNYIPAIHDVTNSYAIINVLRTENLFPLIDAPERLINGVPQHGGYAQAGDVLMTANPNSSGTVYYTLNGSDPRIPGGAVNPDARVNTEILYKSEQVKARVLDNGQWSALSDAIYAVGPVAGNLRISELMYHPQSEPAGNPNAEFIELYNIGGESINLNLVQFDKGIDFTFSDWQLAAGEYVVIVKDQAVFADQYPGFSGALAGEYVGSLDNGGERLRLIDAIGAVIHDFEYNDSWYVNTDGDGFSLTVRDVGNADSSQWSYMQTWRSSASRLGTPGTADVGAIINK